MKTSLYIIFSLIITAGIFSISAFANSPISVKQKSIRAENPRTDHEESLVLPYAFSAESLGTVIGVGGGVSGRYQEHLLLGGSVFGSPDEDTYGLVFGAWDYRPPWSDRLFLTAVGSYGRYPKQQAYYDLLLRPGDVPAGSNSSDKDNYIEAGGNSIWLDIKMEYVLPIGAASESSVMHYYLRDGLLEKGATGGKIWNPLKGGITSLIFRQYNQLESFDTKFGDYERTIHPFEVGIGYNNTDYPVNPSEGSEQYVGLKRDFGWGEAVTSWTFIELEMSKYFSLGKSERAKQRVIALNFWTGDAPTWEESVNKEGSVEFNGDPPQYDGGTLGGFYRMRAYPTGRFHDRSVIYSTAEYRYTPKWNPIGNISWLDWLSMDWWQFVGYVEGGRVANEYSASELFSDWKFDVGFGLRAMMAGGVVRFDYAVSKEDSSMWVMFGHPF